ncbi:MAG: hypothetical protein WC642_08440 [Nocardioides sp.]|jgi:hypothetical protein
MTTCRTIEECAAAGLHNVGIGWTGSLERKWLAEIFAQGFEVDVGGCFASLDAGAETPAAYCAELGVTMIPTNGDPLYRETDIADAQTAFEAGDVDGWMAP